MVLPSFAEGLPVVIMEAMAMGRPVLTTPIAGIPELVEDGVTGFVVPAGDVDALVAKIADVLALSDEKIHDIAAAARARVLRQHDASVEAGKLKNAFMEFRR